MSYIIIIGFLLYLKVYISQILVASALGSVVDAFDSVRVIPVVASGGSFLGFLTACFLVIYPDPDPDPDPDPSEEDQCLDSLSGKEDQNGESASDQTLTLLNLADRDALKKTENHSVA